MDTKGKNIRTIRNNRKTMKVMAIVFMIAIFTACTMVTAYANGASDGVKAIYENIVDITRVAGALLALFGVIQIGVSIGQTHDAAQRMTGILIAAGGAMIFFATDILGMMGINP